jgi:hypothetical protein
MVHWTDSEIVLFRANIDKTNKELYEMFPGKPTNTIRSMKTRFKRNPNYRINTRYWSDREIRLLFTIYPLLQVKQLLPLFPGRKYVHLVNMYSRLIKRY